MSKHSITNHFKKKYHPKKLISNAIKIVKNYKIIRSKQKRPTKIFGFTIFKLLSYLIPILLILCLLISFEIKYYNRFLPNIFVAGESVGGKTYEQVLNDFKQKEAKIKKNGLILNFEGSKGIQKISIPISTTGFTSDNSIEYFTLNNWENDLQKAYKWVHKKNPFYFLQEQFRLIFGKKNFNFSTNIQREAISSLLDNELKGFLKDSAPASFLSIENKLTITKEKIGEIIKKEEVLNILEKKLTQFDTTPIDIKTIIDIPTIRRTHLIPFLNFAENFSKETTLVFQYQEHKWNIKGTKLITWLTIKEENKLSIDNLKLENYLKNTVSEYIDSPPKNSRFKIQKGKLVEIVSGKAGNIIDIDNLIQKIEKIISDAQINLIPANKINLPIEIIKVKPKITQETINKYLIKNLVGEVRTSFQGSSTSREHNIKIGVEAIDGILIAPDAEFSTIASIGPVTEKEGYLKETVIKKDKTAKEFGGGLCQVATTLFRLALNSGLPITERMNHRFVVQYYNPVGIDATIYGPHPDFRFINDTNGYLLLQARVENKQVIMELYGQKDGRTVEISKPVLTNRIPAPTPKYISSMELPFGQTKCSEMPHEGITANFLYTVNYPDGTIKKRNFLSIYQPWQKVCLVGKALY